MSTSGKDPKDQTKHLSDQSKDCNDPAKNVSNGFEHRLN